MILKPLTDQLKKNGFQWNEKTKIAFERLKRAMCTAPVLALPDPSHFLMRLMLVKMGSVRWGWTYCLFEQGFRSFEFGQIDL